MDKNNWKKYFVYAAILFCYFIASDQILNFLYRQRASTYNILPSIILSPVVFIILGALLGLEHFLYEKSKKGLWKIDLPRIILLGIPFFYFSIGYLIISFCPISQLKQILFYPMQFILNSKMSQSYLTIFQVLLGYVVTTSFYKVSDLEE